MPVKQNSFSGQEVSASHNSDWVKTTNKKEHHPTQHPHTKTPTNPQHHTAGHNNMNEKIGTLTSLRKAVALT